MAVSVSSAPTLNFRCVHCDRPPARVDVDRDLRYRTYVFRLHCHGSVVGVDLPFETVQDLVETQAVMDAFHDAPPQYREHIVEEEFPNGHRARMVIRENINTGERTAISRDPVWSAWFAPEPDPVEFDVVGAGGPAPPTRKQQDRSRIRNLRKESQGEIEIDCKASARSGVVRRRRRVRLARRE